MYCPQCKSESIIPFESEVQDLEGNEEMTEIQECHDCGEQFILLKNRI